MEFKIDTRERYTVITPVISVMEGAEADELTGKIAELGKNGSENYIIDLGEVQQLGDNTLERLAELHEQMYGEDRSLVFTGLQQAVYAAVKDAEADLVLNITPTMIEAVDIISMEIVERDILGEA